MTGLSSTIRIRMRRIRSLRPQDAPTRQSGEREVNTRQAQGKRTTVVRFHTARWWSAISHAARSSRFLGRFASVGMTGGLGRSAPAASEVGLVVEGEFHEGVGSLETELLADGGALVLDRPVVDPERGADLFARLRLRDQL